MALDRTFKVLIFNLRMKPNKIKIEPLPEKLMYYIRKYNNCDDYGRPLMVPQLIQKVEIIEKDNEVEYSRFPSGSLTKSWANTLQDD